MKSFEEMFSKFYGAEIDDASQIEFNSLKGEELKAFVTYCIEQAGINTNVVRPSFGGADGGELLQGEASEKGVSAGVYCNCPKLNRNTTLNWCSACNKPICA